MQVHQNNIFMLINYAMIDLILIKLLQTSH